MTAPFSYELFTEEQITKRLFKSLASANAVVAQSWRGYGTRVDRNRTERYYFNREFDVAQFVRQTTQPIFGGPFHSLSLYGYEVKGYTKDKKGRWIRPAYAAGIEQALVLLQQGADWAYLVLPATLSDDEFERMKQLFALCDTWCQCIGITFAAIDGTFFPYRHPQQNPHTTPDKKKTLLLRLISDGYVKEISTADWAKKHEF